MLCNQSLFHIAAGHCSSPGALEVTTKTSGFMSCIQPAENGGYDFQWRDWPGLGRRLSYTPASISFFTHFSRPPRAIIDWIFGGSLAGTVSFSDVEQ